MSSTTQYARERAVATAAVLKACYAAREVQSQLAEAKTVTKDDKSPVTVADYTAQALISSLLFAHFDYPLVGEEDAQDLRSDGQSELRKAICTRADAALAASRDDGDEWKKLGSSRTEGEWLDAIDRGNAASAAKGRTWCLDPIDGTKGFLRGGQYAVCLALIEDGQPVLGVVGCPNLPVDPSQPSGAKGVIFSAVRGSGAVQRSLTDPTEAPIRMHGLGALADASFCESVESGHSDQGTNARIAQILGITKPSVRMDSQAKYCSISRADGDIYLRLPVSASYQRRSGITRRARSWSPRPAASCPTATVSRSTLRKGGRWPRTRA